MDRPSFYRILGLIPKTGNKKKNKVKNLIFFFLDFHDEKRLHTCFVALSEKWITLG
jgi:hypothetical protein